MSDSIILIGAGGHATACIDVVEQDGRFGIAGLVATPRELGRKVFGYQVIGTDEDLPALLARHRNVLIAVGQITTPAPRVRLFERLMQLGGTLPTIVSPRAYVSRHATVGEGTIVMHAAVVNAGASIGRNCIINSHALVEHDARVADHCHIATGAILNGAAQIGAETFIGSASCVREGRVVGARCVIGMGQRVLADCPDGVQLPQKAVVRKQS